MASDSKQAFSQRIVERKRYRRTLVAVINGIPAADAIRNGLVEEASQDQSADDDGRGESDANSMFVPESTVPAKESTKAVSGLDPKAAMFSPTGIFGTPANTSKPATGNGNPFGFGAKTPLAPAPKPVVDNPFGRPVTTAGQQSPSIFGRPTETTSSPSIFGKPNEAKPTTTSASAAGSSSPPPSLFGKPSATPSVPSIFGQPSTGESAV